MCFLSYAFLSQDTTTRQIDRVQRRISKPYEHHCLKDNIEKKRRTFVRKNSSVCCLCYCSVVVSFPCTYVVFISRKGDKGVNSNNNIIVSH